MDVLTVTAVGSNRPNQLCQLRIIGEDGAGITRRAEVLSRVEARARSESEATGRCAEPGRALGLRGVLDDDRAAAVCDLGQLLDRCRLSEQVDRDDGLGLRTDQRRRRRRDR